MSQEVFEIIQGMDRNSIATQLAMQCAPMIAGLKISNLLIIPNGEVQTVLDILENTTLDFKLLLQSSKKTTILVYQREYLFRYILKKEIRQFLTQQGYETTELDKILELFGIRYRRHRMNNGAFPHEMGILLGYPLVDVVGFIENEGQDFLYNGYWKVYGNVQETIRCFARFEQAEKKVLSMVARGMNIAEIVTYYNRHVRRCVS